MHIHPWLVVKFGGNSVSSLTNWQTIAKIVQQRRAAGQRILIVCSALAGISNQLEVVLNAAVKGDFQALLSRIIAAHRHLAAALQVNLETVLAEELRTLERMLTGISLIAEVSPSMHAKVLSLGELMLTKLGAAYLEQNFFPISWCDARKLLVSNPEQHTHFASQYLAARCSYQPEPALIDQLAQLPHPIAITQGFIASNPAGETVLLGRGGSDTSAAYFAAKLRAVGCEIWTDVPGIYTANPQQIPQAKSIKALNYDEAQEIASMGAKVLHPHCIPPLKLNQIPLYIGYTVKPDRPGTYVTHNSKAQATSVIKCIASKPQVVLMQIDSIQMWHQVGFLVDIFQCFKQHGVSIDLISSSETSITVSLDLKINAHDEGIIAAVLTDLNKFSKATALKPCAIVSIIGSQIRTVLPKLSEAFKLFSEQRVYLLSQAANDLNLSFVVDDDQALNLVQKLHHLLIESNPTSEGFDQSWQEEFG